MKKDLGIIFGLFLLIVLFLIFGRSFSSISFLGGSGNSGPVQSPKKTGMTDVAIRDLQIKSEVVSEGSGRKRGLSGRNSIPLDSGMLFVFQNEGLYGIWMKDMKFAIDIIWVNDEKRVVDIAHRVPPEPDKKDSELTVYRPKETALYILEINAGLAELNNLQVGDSVNFEL